MYQATCYVLGIEVRKVDMVPVQVRETDIEQKRAWMMMWL